MNLGFRIVLYKYIFKGSVFTKLNATQLAYILAKILLAIRWKVCRLNLQLVGSNFLHIFKSFINYLLDNVS